MATISLYHSVITSFDRQTCQIPVCSHTYEDREKMIKRKNFTVFVEHETMEEITKLAATLEK